MNQVWNYDFPSKTSAFSSLACNDSTLYMFNFGFGLRDGRQRTKMGRPFIAAFDKKTGACQFMNLLSLKKDMVEDAVLNPDGAFMLFDDGLAYKRDLNDSTVTISSWEPSSPNPFTPITNSRTCSMSLHQTVFISQ